ncbi:MAG: FAD-binding oxidoreductase, partial [Pseudomonadota bacterium]
RPKTTAEVAQIVRFCSDRGIGIVPYGGGTGLVGGQVAEHGDMILLSLERMTALRGIWPEEMVMTVEAGMVLADVQAKADAVERLFPLSLAAEGSARIGGNLATNAGGTQVLRYGNARDLCLGVEAVLPNGEIFNGLSRLRKDNTGYDLKNLLIGSEGTLGIITAASLKLFPKPAEIGTALMAVHVPRVAIDLLNSARDQFGDAVTGFELMSDQGPKFLADKMPQIRMPISPVPKWSVLIEIVGGQGSETVAWFTDFLGKAMEADLILDAVIAQNEVQRAEIWTMRESIPEANRLVGSVSSHDISVPIGAIPEFIETTTPKLAALGVVVNCFGHLGDGNLHYNVFPPKGKTRADFEDRRDEIKRMVHDAVHALGGSVSAEHGIGRLKTKDLELYSDPAKLAAMRAIKQALDPKGIMNPGVIFKE